MQKFKSGFYVLFVIAAISVAFLSGHYTAVGQDPIGDVDRATDAWDRQDRQLNVVYKSLTKDYANSPDAKLDLIEAERAWIKYRDAEASFEARQKAPETGRLWPLEYAKSCESLTREQIKRLNAAKDLYNALNP